MENDKEQLNNSELINQLMGEISEEQVSQEGDAAVEADSTTTETEEATPAEGGQETVVSQPTSNNEVNKSEAIKALKGKIKDLTAQLRAKDTPAEVTPEVKVEEPKPEVVEDAEDETELTLLRKRLEAIENRDKQKQDAEKTKFLEDTLVDFIDESGLTKEEDLRDFIAEAKKEFDIDFIAKPNKKTMLALFNGALGEKYKDKVEQEVLKKLKNGEVPEVNTSEDVNPTVRQTKQQQQAYEDWEKTLFNNVKRKIHGA